MTSFRRLRACLLIATIGSTGIALAQGVPAGAPSCVGPGAPPRSLVAGQPAFAGSDDSIWSMYELVVTGTVLDIRTDEDRDSSAYGATEIDVEVINAMGVDAIAGRVTISARDPGWMNGYGFVVGRTYFIPLTSPGPDGQQYWSFVCDPISEISADDAAALPAEVAAGVPTAVPADAPGADPPPTEAPSDADQVVAFDAEPVRSSRGIGPAGWIAAGAAAAVLAAGGLLLRRRRSTSHEAADPSS